MTTNESLSSVEELTGAVKPAVRIQRNLLAASERRLLTWLCYHLPRWMTPDILTMTGLIGMALVFAGYALSSQSLDWLWLAIIGFCVNWFGDSLDGSLARFRKTERPQFGYFIDHSTDALGNLIAMIGLGLSPFVRLDVALFGVAAYLLLSIHTFLVARVVDEFRLSYMAVGPTELRLVLIAMSLTMLGLGVKPPIWLGLSPFDIFVGGLGIILVGLFIAQTFTTGLQLHRAQK